MNTILVGCSSAYTVVVPLCSAVLVREHDSGRLQTAHLQRHGPALVRYPSMRGLGLVRRSSLVATSSYTEYRNVNAIPGLFGVPLL